MRMLLAALPLAMTFGLNACGEPAAAPEAQETPIVLQAGQWALTRTTTAYSDPTLGPAAHKAKLAEVREDKLCIAVDAAGVPDAAALAAGQGKDCSYTDKLLRKGRLIATLQCRSGAAPTDIAIEGNYTNDTLTIDRTASWASDPGTPVSVTQKVTGKRIGDCPKA